MKDNKKLLKEAIDALDLYLNAGSKSERKKASELAKSVYQKYYGYEYVNKIDR